MTMNNPFFCAITLVGDVGTTLIIRNYSKAYNTRTWTHKGCFNSELNNFSQQWGLIQRLDPTESFSLFN